MINNMFIFTEQLFDTWYEFVKKSAALDPQSINQHLAVKLDVRISFPMHNYATSYINAHLRGIL